MAKRRVTEPEVLPAKTSGFEQPVSQKDAQEVFRFLFASDSSLIEMLQRDVVVRLDDLKELNSRLADKLIRNGVTTVSFKAMVRFEDGQARQFGQWEKFAQEDWGTPKVIDSISATWRFLLSEPNCQSKPHIHSLNLLISSSLKPLNVMQAMFSKKIEDLEDLELIAMPMTCRIDFQDHVISQEVVSLVADWNKSLPQPQHVFPFMQWFKRKSNAICHLIRCSLPALLAIVSYVFFLNRSASFKPDSALTAGQLLFTVRWLAMTVAAIFLSCRVAAFLARVIERNLARFGQFQAIEITKGDQNRQAKLMAKNSQSFWKFIASSILALIWNIAGGVLTAILLERPQH